jgi:hypothetical protein
MRRILALVGALLCVPLGTAFAAGAPQPAAFSHRFALDLVGLAPYYAAVLPSAVYAAGARSDLGDLRVFNGAGEPVPYSFDAPLSPVSQGNRSRPVKWFPLPKAEGEKPTASAGLSVAPDGTLRLSQRARVLPTRDTDVVDTGADGAQIAAVLIDLRDASYQGRVSVEASGDLHSWQAVGEAQLLKVQYGGETLLQQRIDLDRLVARYLRLHWLDRAPDIAAIEVETAGPNTAPAANAREWRDGVVARAGGMAGEYLLDVGGAYPVDRLRFALPQPNTVAHGTLYSRPDANSPWHEVAQTTLYRLVDGGGEQRNRPIEIEPDADRHWRLVVDPRNGGLGSGTLTAGFGWRPGTLTFVARGAGPFTIAVGNAGIEGANISRADLLVAASPVIGQARVGVPLAAVPGPAIAAQASAVGAGMARRRFVLWSALVLAVGVLATIAWRLMRQPAPR